MTQHTPGSAKIEKILIVRLSAMGDVIHTLPAAQVLRDAFPQALIGWLIEERWAELLCGPGTPRRGERSPQRPLVDWVHTVNLVGWRKSIFSLSTMEQIARVWNDVRSVGYDVAVDLQGAIRSALLARWSGAPVIYGSALPREAPASLWYGHPVIPEGLHVVEQNLSVAAAIAGRVTQVPGVQLPDDHETYAALQQQIPQGKFAIVNPGAGWGAKRWPAERYGLLARALADCGVLAIVNYGPGEEELARDVEAASNGYATPIRCSISELITLTRRAALFVGGDTGPLHLAAALGVPVVGIFGPTDPARNGPFSARSIVLRNPASETSHVRRSQPDEGMLEITVDSVVQAARSLLAGDAEGANG